MNDIMFNRINKGTHTYEKVYSDKKIYQENQSDISTQVKIYIGSNSLVTNIRQLNLPKKNHVDQYIKLTNMIETDIVTQILRVAQKIMSIFADYVIPFIGWSVIFLSFLAIFTDPSQTFSLLSILKGVGLGCAILYLGPIIPNLLKDAFEWLEMQWIASHFPEDDVTIDELKAWYRLFSKEEEDDSYYVTQFSLFSHITDDNEFKIELCNLIRKINEFNIIKKSIESPENPGSSLFLSFLKA